MHYPSGSDVVAEQPANLSADGSDDNDGGQIQIALTRPYRCRTNRGSGTK